ncbi:MAG TPA: hypothetical protein PK228_16750 [Saprospiraceae bacterium]|nr:hypothetical protein [Saprospiraceae bacterium]
MSATTEYRYPGIQPFTGQQKDLFFGRDDDRERLLSLLLLEKLTVLFGKSGYGKSSLLNAGIAPGLEKESRRGKRAYIPVFIRFHSRIGNEQYDWFDWFSFQLAQHAPPIDPELYEQRRFLPRTLWGELKRRQTQDNQVFVLLFDQFEELFTYPSEQIAAFKQQLADLLYADIPAYLEQNEEAHTPEEAAWMSRNLDVRVLFSVRADRLSQLDQLKDTLPAILNKRYELRALTCGQAREALEKPAALPDEAGFAFKSPAFHWQPAALEKALAELSRDKQGRETGIEAFQLQILAQNVENRVIRGKVADRDGDGKPDVGVSDLPGIGRLYEAFYEDALGKLAASDRKKARRLIEQGLIFEQDNQRINLHEKLINRDYGVHSTLTQQLIDLRLLRAEPSTSGGQNIELSHDSFVFPILNVARRRKQEQWRKRALILGVFAGLLIVVLGVGGVFNVAAKKSGATVIRQNVVLTNQLDSIKVVRNLEEEAKSVALKYLECVNNHDISCASALMTDTLEQYYTAKNLPRAKREKLERNYYSKNPVKGQAHINDIMVEKKDSVYEVTVNTDFLHPAKGEVQVIYRIRLNAELKLYHLRSFIAQE